MYNISISDLHLSFNGRRILDNINLNISNSESLAIIGESGSGKSSLIKTLILLNNPNSGTIKVNQVEIQKNKSYLKDCGILFQNCALFDNLKIWENIAFNFKQRLKINKTLAKELAINKLHSIGLDSNILNMYPVELSGGMKKRVALARAIANNPKMIILDEPTSGLDPIMSHIVNKLIIKIHNKLKPTIITITHDIHSAIKIADTIAVLHQGKIICIEEAKNILNSTNKYVQKFIKYSTD